MSEGWNGASEARARELDEACALEERELHEACVLEETSLSVEESPLAAPPPAPSARMLQMENAALIQGLRALNEQVQRLEEDRNRLLEAEPVLDGGRPVLQQGSPANRWPDGEIYLHVCHPSFLFNTTMLHAPARVLSASW